MTIASPRATAGRTRAARLPAVPLALDAGIAALLDREPRFGEIVARAGAPLFPGREPGFGTLLHIILEQQVSTQAAAAMYARLRAICRPLRPAAFLALDDETLRACGFSRQKMSYARALAAAIRDRRFEPLGLHALPDDDVVAALTALKGFGPWSAQCYLLFVLGRDDVWPAADLALQVAAQRLLGLPDRPNTAALRLIGEAWRPWRSAAACLLWQSYLHERGQLRERSTSAG